MLKKILNADIAGLLKVRFVRFFKTKTFFTFKNLASNFSNWLIFKSYLVKKLVIRIKIIKTKYKILRNLGNLKKVTLSWIINSKKIPPNAEPLFNKNLFNKILNLFID